MLNLVRCGGHSAGRPGMGHPRASELIMHWMDVCTDPRARTGAGTVAATSLTHRDQLVAVWIEQDTTLPQSAS
jgi:hypothetical protein